MTYILTHGSKLSTIQKSRLFSLAVEKGVADVVFYEGQFHSWAGWLQYLRVTNAWLVQCETPEGEVCGFWWLNGYTGKAAQIHFCFWGLSFDEAVTLGRQSLHWLFGLGEIISVYGMTPKPWRHVFPFIEALGFRRGLELPGACFIKRKDKHVAGVSSVCVPEEVPEI